MKLVPSQSVKLPVINDHESPNESLFSPEMNIEKRVKIASGQTSTTQPAVGSGLTNDALPERCVLRLLWQRRRGGRPLLMSVFVWPAEAH